MKYEANTPKDYIDALPADRKKVIAKIRTILKKNLPKGFKEELNYNMLGYVVPHSLYPSGYHCNPDQPLPFINLASQKNFVALYHMGIYSDKKLLAWFQKAYKEAVGTKPDMGKSCIRFKKMDNIPYELIGELAEKITPQQWIDTYENTVGTRRTATKSKNTVKKSATKKKRSVSRTVTSKKKTAKKTAKKTLSG